MKRCAILIAACALAVTALSPGEAVAAELCTRSTAYDYAAPLAAMPPAAPSERREDGSPLRTPRPGAHLPAGGAGHPPRCRRRRLLPLRRSEQEKGRATRLAGQREDRRGERSRKHAARARDEACPGRKARPAPSGPPGSRSFRCARLLPGRNRLPRPLGSSASGVSANTSASWPGTSTSGSRSTRRSPTRAKRSSRGSRTPAPPTSPSGSGRRSKSSKAAPGPRRRSETARCPRSGSTSGPGESASCWQRTISRRAPPPAPTGSASSFSVPGAHRPAPDRQRRNALRRIPGGSRRT